MTIMNVPFKVFVNTSRRPTLRLGARVPESGSEGRAPALSGSQPALHSRSASACAPRQGAWGPGRDENGQDTGPSFWSASVVSIWLLGGAFSTPLTLQEREGWLSGLRLPFPGRSLLLVLRGQVAGARSTWGTCLREHGAVTGRKALLCAGPSSVEERISS